MKNYVGIDLGTSSVKLMQRFEDGTIRTTKQTYTEKLPEGWWNAVIRGLSELKLSETAGIGLSAQVGTFVLDDDRIIPWNSPEGSEEIEKAKSLMSPEEWVQEISMIQPGMVSYPAPRFLYIAKHYPEVRKICYPKEYLIERLTGRYVTDPYSWRGLTNLGTMDYSKKLLKLTGISRGALPELLLPQQEAGRTLAGSECAAGCLQSTENAGIPAGIPVYAGMNDYFSSLLGMGMQEGEIFDITGTSEHLGMIETSFVPDADMVNGPYLESGFAHYGVTGSGGDSLNFGLRLSEAAERPNEKTLRQTPVFLPYLSGERAPIWDANACGVFFGLKKECDRKLLAYSVMEGVVFSLYSIYEALGKPQADRIILSGGAAANPLLNQLKADLFGLPVRIVTEKDTSALGAVITAMVGDGCFGSYREAAAALRSIGEEFLPEEGRREQLLQRYEIYRHLYPLLKEEMHRFNGMGKE